MLSHRFLATALVAGLLALAAAPAPASASHVVDREDNDNCSQANALEDGGFHVGYIDGYPGDWRDYYKRWANAGDTITLFMMPGYYDGEAEFNLVLLSPYCGVAAFDYKTGTASETITFRATMSGAWFAEVWGHYGSGYYGIEFQVSSPPPPCEHTGADPSTYTAVAIADGPAYYVEERGNPLGTRPPVPGSGLLLGEGTWVYQESNGLAGLQRGGIDETCDAGPDALIV